MHQSTNGCNALMNSNRKAPSLAKLRRLFLTAKKYLWAYYYNYGNNNLRTRVCEQGTENWYLWRINENLK